MSRAISRMRFLRGHFDRAQDPIRPPWALPEHVFTARCDRCNDCISVCPQGILTKGGGGYPQVDFNAAGCTFCGDCLKACRGRALLRVGDPAAPPWRLAAVIGGNCLSLRGTLCRSCGDACESAAIRFRLVVGGTARPLLDPKICTGCGECVGVCPVGAVAIRCCETPTEGG